MNDFFPTNDYSIPSTSNYMKFQDGENAFRVLSSAVIGWEYFNRDNKPVRSREPFEGTPENIKPDGQVKHFWAFLVWNYQDRKVQVLELTQKGIMQTMQNYIKNPKWGDPRDYDFIVNRSGTGFDTEYSVTVNPKSPAPEVKVPAYDLNALYENGDVFAQGGSRTVSHPSAGNITVPNGDPTF